MDEDVPTIDSPRRLVLTLVGDSTDIAIDFQGMYPYEAPLVLEAARGKIMQELRGEA